MFEYENEHLLLRAAARQRADRVAVDSEIAELSEHERGYFFEALRCGASSMGQAFYVARRRARRPTAPAAPTAKPATHDLLSFPKPATAAKTYPADACRLRAGSPFELRAADSGSATGAVVANVLARSGKGIAHPFWGVLIHDLAGKEQLKDRLPLDYCHDAGEVLGYAESWRTEGNNLVCKATLLPGESKRALEVVNLARKGVPYEASISFAPLAIEELKPGQTTTINGQLVTGPASIIRRWRLTGLAVCPRGADPHTKAELSARGEVEVSLVR